MIKFTRPVMDHLEYTNSNGYDIKCEDLELEVSIKAGYEEHLNKALSSILQTILSARLSYPFIAVKINGLMCTIVEDGTVSCSIDNYTRGGLNADWCVPVWYICGDSEKGIVIADTEDSNQYEVIAFERRDDGDDKFITLHNGSVASCVQFVKSMSK